MRFIVVWNSDGTPEGNLQVFGVTIGDRNYPKCTWELEVHGVGQLDLDVLRRCGGSHHDVLRAQESCQRSARWRAGNVM